MFGCGGFEKGLSYGFIERFLMRQAVSITLYAPAAAIAWKANRQIWGYALAYLRLGK